MNVLVIGLFSLNYEGTGGSLFMMLNHGIVSSGLFLVIGSLYDRYHTRIIFYYRGLSKYMPYMNIVFIVLTLANIGLPGTSSFVSELLLLLGIGKISTFLAFVVCSTCITSAVYGLWLYSRIMLGVISTKPVYLNYFYDYNERELLTFLPIVSFILIFGLVPDTFYTFTHQENLNSYINFIN
jgi:NADH-quinone oxidoreductase subunit M